MSTSTTLAGKLKSLGYELYLEGDKVKYRYILSGDPPADKVMPLLDELREHKEETITQLRFKQEFDRLAEHLRQRNYTPENFAKLQTLSLEMDKSWEAMNYCKFEKAIDEMMQIPGKLRAEGNKPVGAKIFSHILQDIVWIALDPSFVGDGDGIPIYTVDEIKGLRGATPEEIRQVHMIKRELGGNLVAVTNRGEG